MDTFKKYKRGMVLKNLSTGKRIRLVRRATGNRHWTAAQLEGKTSHHIHEGTLDKFYKEEDR